MPAPSASTPRRLPTVSPRLFTRFALISFIGLCLIVLSGAAVRLSGSGLGCPDWPSCYAHRLTAQDSIHPLIEFGNRLITIGLVVVVGATTIAAHLRVPRRRDLIIGSWLLVAGIVGDAVLGGIVVYTKLNPYLVMTHMWLSLAMVAVAVTLHHRSRYDYSPGARAEVASVATKRIAFVIAGIFMLVVAAGSATTGAGPHAGGSQGQLVAKRIPVALIDMAWAHSALAMLFIGTVLATYVVLEGIGAPARLRGGAQRLFFVGVAQGIIGFTQYLTHLPVLLVELHVLGAVSLTIGVTSFVLAQTARDKEAAPSHGAAQDVDAALV